MCHITTVSGLVWSSLYFRACSSMIVSFLYRVFSFCFKMYVRKSAYRKCLWGGANVSLSNQNHHSNLTDKFASWITICSIISTIISFSTADLTSLLCLFCRCRNVLFFEINLKWLYTPTDLFLIASCIFFKCY